MFDLERKFDRIPRPSSRAAVASAAATALSALALSGSFSGCELPFAKTGHEYDPIQVPEDSTYLGTSSGGKSFMLNTADAKDVKCGKESVSYAEPRADREFSQERVVTITSEGSKAQVTCLGSDSDFPVEKE